MTSLVVVWYLIIRDSYEGGIVAVPQVSREQCLDNAKWLYSSYPKHVKVNCIPGTR